MKRPVQPTLSPQARGGAVRSQAHDVMRIEFGGRMAATIRREAIAGGVPATQLATAILRDALEKRFGFAEPEINTEEVKSAPDFLKGALSANQQKTMGDEAKTRGVPTKALLKAIVKNVVEHKLYDAVLDGDLPRKP